MELIIILHHMFMFVNNIIIHLLFYVCIVYLTLAKIFEVMYFLQIQSFKG